MTELIQWPEPGDGPIHTVRAIDSHTEGEPTRVVVAGGPALEGLDPNECRHALATRCDAFRTAVCCEPRGSDHLVGALLIPPRDPQSLAGVVFFDNGGYLGMCGHGTIGVAETLRYLGRVEPGTHKIETPVGPVHFMLHGDGQVTVRNVPSYRHAHDVEVETRSGERFRGDVAWGGNWFFIARHHAARVELRDVGELTRIATEIRRALRDAGITGGEGAEITHVELTVPPMSEDEDGRNFVLCPGLQYDRSPCGTGTSAKIACLAADGALAPGQPWRQAGILGTRFVATYQPRADGRVDVEITGRAWITGDVSLRIDAADPLTKGIVK